MQAQSPPLAIETAPLAALAARLQADDGPAPGAAALLAVVGRLHGLVADLRPSPADLRAVIDFLTEVGHATDARRQEWVLLADVLGVSTLVEDLHSQRPAGATPNTVAGPFYRDDAPDLPLGADLCRDGKGVPLAVQGMVELPTGLPAADALLEVWHANADGIYENQHPDLQPEFNLRGRFRCDPAGRFHFRTIRPGGYALPEDGPVGRLMNSFGLRLERPAHLHFRISHPAGQRLTTHVFDRADPAIGRDALFGVKPALLADLHPQATGAGLPGWGLSLRFVLAPPADAPLQPEDAR